jgi:hypothetical protein
MVSLNNLKTQLISLFHRLLLKRLCPQNDKQICFYPLIQAT